MSTKESEEGSLQQLPRKRSTKVRTGCLTCKVRRIKCDETKPACLRCRSSGRECGGYPLIKTLTFEIVSDETEKRSFYYYRETTLQHLNSFQQFRFWDRLVIQASYAHEAVRRMVVSIGALNEAFDHQDGESSRQLQTMALEQYSRALGQTVSRIEVIPQEHLLIAALMFSFFESIRGYPMTALRHLYSAISGLLKHRGDDRRIATIEDELRPILAATHIRASALYPQVLQPPLRVESSLPDQFASMAEAHFHFFSIARGISTELDTEYRSMSVGTSQALDGPRYLARLNAWRELFIDFINGSESTCRHEQPHAEIHHQLGVLFMQIQYLASATRLSAAVAASEIAYDGHIDCVTRILRVYDDMLEIQRQSDYRAIETSNCLGFTPSVLPTLAMMALRCREPSIRRRIITLVRRSGNGDGQLGNTLAAEILQRTMELEEGAALGRVQHANDIPADSRITVAAITLFRLDPTTSTYTILSEYSDPDLIRVRYIRPSAFSSPETLSQLTGYESFWIDRRSPEIRTNIPYPEDVQPLFPQLQTTTTNLFSGNDPMEDLLMTYRASYCQIFVAPLAPRQTSTEPADSVRRSFVMSSVALGLVGAGELTGLC